MNSETIRLLSRQYYHEISNAIKYQRFAHAFALAGLTGIAKFLNEQSKGELSHAQHVMSHIADRMIELTPGTVETVEEMQPEEANLLLVFERILSIETLTTAMLIELEAQAKMAGDVLTSQWLYDSAGLLKEQIEEENIIMVIVNRIKSRMLDDSATGGIDYDIDTWIEQEFNSK